MTLTLTIQSFSRPTAASIVKRVSVTGDGAEANERSGASAFSADGRYAFFESRASNLDAEAGPLDWDIFRKDLVTGEVVRISTNTAGDMGNGDSFSARFSADGRYAVFTSRADNLVAGDVNGKADIFLKDLVTGQVTLVSTDGNRWQVSGDSGQALISPDGRYVVFESDAPDLVPNDTNNAHDIFIKDLFTGAVARLSTSKAGEGGNGASRSAQISPDGRYVLFESSASNLVSGDDNGNADVFLKDVLTGEIRRISTDISGAEGNGYSYQARFSADGRSVVFTSSASNLVSGDTNGDYDVFQRDLATGAIVRLSTSGTGIEVHGWSEEPRLSQDGRYLFFASTANDVVPGGGDGTVYNLFRKDLLTGEVVRLSTSPEGLPADGHTGYGIDVSPDGRYVLVGSWASNLVPGDTNGMYDTFLIDATLMKHAPAVMAGRYVELRLGTGSASSISIDWGDGAIDTVSPSGGSAGFSHVFASSGVQNAVATVVEDGRSWSVPYTMDLASGQMMRNPAMTDTLTGSHGSDRLNGDLWGNRIIGRNGSDRIDGSSGNDILWGGTGNDSLKGGDGRDSFVFDTRPNKSSNVDRVYDFKSRDDSIWLDNKYFTKLGSGSASKPKKVKADMFVEGNKALDAEDRIVYDRKTGALYYDQDGTGSKAQVKIATITTKTKLYHHDFFVV
ncbi:Tol biopolymer transport system component [Microvirga lupini]|uniref:Tol biopolymer transport system component n=1 Tax=Microvirga lupini TaxID=420324 RepID=A0A7W4VNR6_9HYPH|nr:PD40 domain-containing protein [Microvirga lupini]MBB3020518.1 Tol biopolymer transport system component [Microvirga lupini]